MAHPSERYVLSLINIKIRRIKAVIFRAKTRAYRKTRARAIEILLKIRGNYINAFPAGCRGRVLVAVNCETNTGCI